MGMTERVAEALKQLARTRRLSLNVYAYFVVSEAQKLLSGPPPPAVGRFHTLGIKALADGALGSEGALLSAPYQNDPSRHGTAIVDRARLTALTRAALRAGWQVATHAIGDAAIHDTLDAYEAALASEPGHDARLRMEHATMVPVTDRPRFHRLNVIAGIQPIPDRLMPSIGFERKLGVERTRLVADWRELLSAGARIVLGRDAPIDYVDPLRGMYLATTRLDGGKDASEQLTIAEAVAACCLHHGTRVRGIRRKSAGENFTGHARGYHRARSAGSGGRSAKPTRSKSRGYNRRWRSRI